MDDDQPRSATESHEREEAAHASWQEAQQLLSIGAHADALLSWDQLEHFDGLSESVAARMLQVGRTGKAATLVEMGQYREAQRVYALRAAERLHSKPAQALLAWLLVLFYWTTTRLHVDGPLRRLHQRLATKYQNS